MVQQSGQGGFGGDRSTVVAKMAGRLQGRLLRALRQRQAEPDGTEREAFEARTGRNDISEREVGVSCIFRYDRAFLLGCLSLLCLSTGQQLVEEILDAQRPACPPEYFNIEIPEGHRLRNETNHSVLPLLRTRYDMRTGYSPNNPRQQLNEITPYFDGGLFYGTSKAWADYLRTGEDGELEPHGLLAATRERNVKGLFPAYNKQRLPMANPPPPVNHSTFVKDHETLKVERFFSKYPIATGVTCTVLVFQSWVIRGGTKTLSC